MSTKVEKICINPDCKKSFQVFKCIDEKGYGKYCSKRCVLAGSIEVRDKRKAVWMKAQLADIRFRESQ